MLSLCRCWLYPGKHDDSSKDVPPLTNTSELFTRGVSVWIAMAIFGTMFCLLFVREFVLL